MPNVAYIVLHYQEYDETIECDEYIKKNHGCGKTIIAIVDNASPNHSGLRLQQLYEKDSEVYVIINDNNEGFARGLNIGIEYLKKRRNPDFYVLLNNDTVLSSENWDDTIIDLYDKYHFAVLGPDIVSPDGNKHDNPSEKQDITKKKRITISNVYSANMDRNKKYNKESYKLEDTAYKKNEL